MTEAKQVNGHSHTHKIIGGLYRYVGSYHGWAVGQTVLVQAVHRGEDMLMNDSNVGRLRDGDFLEFAPWVPEEGRFSFATGDAEPCELEPVVTP